MKSKTKTASVVDHRDNTMKLSNILLLFLALTSGLVLVACSSKPPGCADTETLKTAKELLVENIGKFISSGEMQPDDPDGWLQKFYDGLKVEITSVVSDGYKEDAKKQLCKGTMTIISVTGATAERSVEYSTQKTEDKAGGFLLEIQNAQPFVQKIGIDALTYYRANRWAGTWNGTYSCSGMKGATEGPHGPFSLPVSMVVEGNKAKLERTTRGGGIEKLAGEFYSLGRDAPFKLEGTGENTPEDSWNTSFTGSVEGKKVVANGAIRLQDGTEMRQCRLDLSLGGSLPAKPDEQSIRAPASAAEPNPAPVPTPIAENVQVSPQATWKPSFDCIKASTFSEKAICSDTLLGKLDGALSENYKYMLASDIGDGARNDLKITQKKWLTERNKCTDNQCLTNAYRKRIDDVCEYPVISGVHPVCTNSNDIK